jgi:hypothetical protein
MSYIFTILITTAVVLTAEHTLGKGIIAKIEASLLAFKTESIAEINKHLNK